MNNSVDEVSVSTTQYLLNNTIDVHKEGNGTNIGNVNNTAEANISYILDEKN